MLEAADHVIVAFDCTQERAYELADELSGQLAWAKVGMELFYACGADLVRDLKARGLKVFLDLKLNDIPNTVKCASRVLAGLGVDMMTIHASGGPAMVAAAREGLDEGAAAAGLPAPKLLAVTVLTSMDAAQLAAVGVEHPIAEQADLLARMALDNGADGVVCSAFEAAAMRRSLGEQALIVTPGIRPAARHLPSARVRPTWSWVVPSRRPTFLPRPCPPSSTRCRACSTRRRVSSMGRLFVVSGPAGAGKGTILGRVREQRPDLALSVSATTRAPRVGEQEGVSYYFLTEEEFRRRIDAGDFLEWANVHGNLYGTLVSEVRSRLEGASLILEIDPQGAMNVRRMMPDCVLVFIAPPSVEVLRERLIGRGSETPETLAVRLADAEQEMLTAKDYDEVVVNDNLDVAVQRFMEIMKRYED